MKFEERSLKARRAETIDKREEHRNGMDLEGENRSEREREEEAFATDIHRSEKLLGIIATTLQQHCSCVGGQDLALVPIAICPANRAMNSSERIQASLSGEYQVLSRSSDSFTASDAYRIHHKRSLEHHNSSSCSCFGISSLHLSLLNTQEHG